MANPAKVAKGGKALAKAAKAGREVTAAKVVRRRALKRRLGPTAFSPTQTQAKKSASNSTQKQDARQTALKIGYTFAASAGRPTLCIAALKSEARPRPWTVGARYKCLRDKYQYRTAAQKMAYKVTSAPSTFQGDGGIKCSRLSER